MKLCIVVSLLVGLCQGYITRIAVRLPLGGEEAPPGSPWPQPQSWARSPDLRTLDPDALTFRSNIEGCDILETLFERYQGWLELDPDAGKDDDLEELRRVVVTVADTDCDEDMYPQDGDDESYSLTIDESDEVRLDAASVWGAIRGMETFSQLVYLAHGKTYHVNQTAITDFPRYGFRGVHIDTARHFLTVPIILQVIESMSWNKFNVLHWHVVDDQSFPYQSRTLPNLTEYGAYSPAHVYSPDDVTEILRAARLRGVRVIPEFDTPGHTWSWGNGMPELITPCWGEGETGGPYVPDYPRHGPREVINPMLESTYHILGTLWREIIDDFPDRFVHLGMDEAYWACWESNPNISAWMVEMNFTGYDQVEEYYNRRLLDTVAGMGARSIIWQDPIDSRVTVPSDTLITVWKDSSLGLPGQFEDWQLYMDNITAQGYPTLLAAPWYLNNVEYGAKWRKLYEVNPGNFTTDEAKQQMVQGGELCLWGEYIDGTNILSVLWPDGSAVAERLWSAEDFTDPDDAQYRLDQMRCHMLRRGIPAKPILPGYCGDYEWGNSGGKEEL